jgi:hypothetical protein
MEGRDIFTLGATAFDKDFVQQYINLLVDLDSDDDHRDSLDGSHSDTDESDDGRDTQSMPSFESNHRNPRLTCTQQPLIHANTVGMPYRCQCNIQPHFIMPLQICLVYPLSRQAYMVSQLLWPYLCIQCSSPTITCFLEDISYFTYLYLFWNDRLVTALQILIFNLTIFRYCSNGKLAQTPCMDLAKRKTITAWGEPNEKGMSSCYVAAETFMWES